MAQQLAGVAQLRALVLRPVLAVDDHRHLHVTVRDGLTQGVLEDDLAVVILVRRGRQPHQRDGIQVPDRRRERLGLLPVDVVLIRDHEQVVSVLQVRVERIPEVLVLGAHFPAHLVGGADQLLHVEDEDLQPLRVAQHRPDVGRLEVVRGDDERSNVSTGHVLGRRRIEVRQGLALDRRARGNHQHVTDPLLSQVLDQRRHQERLADTRGEVRHHLLVADSAIRDALHDLGERVLVRIAQIEPSRDLLDQCLVVGDVHSHVSSPSPSGTCPRGPS
ncbi:hypothetical protein ROTO_37340 [Roseovarius tolerans]|uniref:Uncharacterized protein n=1 Tax=Roseovarius tolerans TaxID=74031 RepID=A0A0L6CPZ9_9RHOB|nr:hypothetical protein ROTO_37340 [Roseovarius tolerans]